MAFVDLHMANLIAAPISYLWREFLQSLKVCPLALCFAYTCRKSKSLALRLCIATFPLLLNSKKARPLFVGRATLRLYFKYVEPFKILLKFASILTPSRGFILSDLTALSTCAFISRDSISSLY